KILDIYEAPEGRDPGETGASTRQSWADYANVDSLNVFDESIKLMSGNGKLPRVTYNDAHIAVGATKRNFAWFIPRKRDKHCMVDIRVGEINAQPMLAKLQTAGVDAYQKGEEEIRIRLLSTDFRNN